jgi:predicted PurR-regulated permease PerM
VAVLQVIVSVVRHSIEPKLMASNMELGTLSALFGMYVGLTTIGVIGLVIGPLLMIALRSLIKARMFVDLVSVERKTISQDEDPLP